MLDDGQVKVESVMKALSMALAACALVAAVPAAADPPRGERGARVERKQRDHDLARQAVLRREVLPLPRILAMAGDYQPGEVIEIELKAREGRVFYDVHVLTPAGAVRELYVDARTGRLIVNRMKSD